MNRARAHKAVHKVVTGAITSLAVICVVGVVTWAWRGITGSTPGPKVVYCQRKVDTPKPASSVPVFRHNDLAEEENEIEVKNAGKGAAGTVAVRVSTDYPIVSLGATGEVERMTGSGRAEPVEQRLGTLGANAKMLELTIPKLLPEQSATIRFVIRRSADDKSTWPRVDVTTEAGAARRIVIRREGWTSREE